MLKENPQIKLAGYFFILSSGLLFLLLTFHKSQAPVILGRYSAKLVLIIIASFFYLLLSIYLVKKEKIAVLKKLKKRFFPTALAMTLASCFIIYFFAPQELHVTLLLVPLFFMLTIGFGIFPQAPQWKVMMKDFLLVLISISLTLGALEVGLRIWLKTIAPPKAKSLYSPALADLSKWIYVPHHYLNYALRPNYVSEDGLNHHNSMGFRDGREIDIPKPKGEFRIVAIGGSTTYSGAVQNWRESYPSQLEKILKEKYGYLNVRVIKGGVGGYNSWESLMNLEFRVLDLEPDLIIDYDGANDFHTRLVPPNKYRGDNSARRRAWDFAKSESWTYRFPSALWRFLAIQFRWINPDLETMVGNPFSKPALASPEFDPVLGMTPMEALQKNPPVYLERNLRNMVAICKERGIKIFFMTFAYNSRTSSYAGSPHHQFAMKEHNDVIRKIAKETSSSFFDLSTVMPLDEKYWTSDGVHMTALGNEKRGQLIADFLISNHLL